MQKHEPRVIWGTCKVKPRKVRATCMLSVLCTLQFYLMVAFPIDSQIHTELRHGSDNTLPIFTWTLHRSHLNKGCYIYSILQYYTPLWNVILSILISQMGFCTMEIHLGCQNWQDYISKGCVIYHNILYSSEICAASG